MTLQRRFETGLLGSIAAVALFLSALGLFGVASLSAARRTCEFGIRLAVGATGGQIVRLELARTTTMVMVGLGLGLLASMAVARMMAGLLFRVAPQQGMSHVGAAMAENMMQTPTGKFSKQWPEPQRFPQFLGKIGKFLADPLTNTPAGASAATQAAPPPEKGQ